MDSYLWMHRVRRLKEIKDTISKGMTWLKANMVINKVDDKIKEGTTYDDYTPK